MKPKAHPVFTAGIALGLVGFGHWVVQGAGLILLLVGCILQFIQDATIPPIPTRRTELRHLWGLIMTFIYLLLVPLLTLFIGPFPQGTRDFSLLTFIGFFLPSLIIGNCIFVQYRKMQKPPADYLTPGSPCSRALRSLP